MPLHKALAMFRWWIISINFISPQWIARRYLSLCGCGIFFIRHHEWITTYQIKAVTLENHPPNSLRSDQLLKTSQVFAPFFTASSLRRRKNSIIRWIESFKQLFEIIFCIRCSRVGKPHVEGNLIEKILIEAGVGSGKGVSSYSSHDSSRYTIWLSGSWESNKQRRFKKKIWLIFMNKAWVPKVRHRSLRRFQIDFVSSVTKSFSRFCFHENHFKQLWREVRTTDTLPHRNCFESLSGCFIMGSMDWMRRKSNKRRIS